MTRLFEDGFESGNFSNWTSTVGSPSITSTVVHHGSYALAADRASSDIHVIKNFTAQSSAYARVYVYVDSLPPASGSLSVLSIRNSNETIVAINACVYNQNGTPKWAVKHYPNWTHGSGEVSDVVVQTGRWYRVELYISRVSSTVSWKLWIDGAQIFSSSHATDKSVDINQVIAGAWDTTGDVYVDCVAVDTNYIGPDITTVNAAGTIGLAGSAVATPLSAVVNAVGTLGLQCLGASSPQVPNPVSARGAICLLGGVTASLIQLNPVAVAGALQLVSNGSPYPVNLSVVPIYGAIYLAGIGSPFSKSLCTTASGSLGLHGNGAPFLKALTPINATGAFNLLSNPQSALNSLDRLDMYGSAGLAFAGYGVGIIPVSAVGYMALQADGFAGITVLQAIPVAGAFKLASNAVNSPSNFAPNHAYGQINLQPVGAPSNSELEPVSAASQILLTMHSTPVYQPLTPVTANSLLQVSLNGETQLHILSPINADGYVTLTSIPAVDLLRWRMLLRVIAAQSHPTLTADLTHPAVSATMKKPKVIGEIIEQ